MTKATALLYAHKKINAQGRIKRFHAKWWHDTHCEGCKLRGELGPFMRIVQGGDLMSALMGALGAGEDPGASPVPPNPKAH